jgi:WD40 repeat protein
MVSATGGPPWEATSTLWDLTGQARPRRLSVFEGGSPATISPDAATVAANAFGGQLALWNVADPARPRLLRRLATAPLVPDNPGPLPHGVSQAGLVFSPDGHTLASVSGRGQVTLWNLTRPDRATRIATLAGPRGYVAALAFSPRGNLLAGVTYHGSVLVYRVAGPAGPVLVTTRPGLLASARFPGGGRAPAIPCGCGADAAYAAAFTADGHALTVVIARPETSPSTAARDTVFTWQVAGSGALSGLTTNFRDVSDTQPALAPGGRIVADGSAIGGEIHLWTLP